VNSPGCRRGGHFETFFCLVDGGEDDVIYDGKENKGKVEVMEGMGELEAVLRGN